MDEVSEDVAARCRILRVDQHELAVPSQKKSSKEKKAGPFQEEGVPIDVTAMKGQESFVVSEDECTRYAADLRETARLRPAFREGATVNAGNACCMSAGADARLVVSPEKVRSFGLQPLFSIIPCFESCRGSTRTGMGHPPTLCS